MSEEPLLARGPERWLLPFVREPMLWPVLLVMIGHLVAFGAALLLLGLRDRRPAALLALAVLLVLCSAGVRAELHERRRPGALTGFALTCWALSGAVAYAAHRYGAF